MKRFFVCFAIIAMIFMVACGGSDTTNHSGEESSSGTSVCSYGTYECHGSDSYFCGYPDSSNDLMWLLSERCSNGCDYFSGKCLSNSGGGNNGGSGNNGSSDNNGNSSGNNDAECTSGKFKCIGSESYYCNSQSSWVYDARCENGCDSATGKCKSNSNDDTDSGDSSDSGNNDHGDSGSTSECTSGKYKCDGSYSYYCSNGYWNSGKDCSYSCNSSTGECYSDESSCTSGDSKCKSSSVYSCGSDGIWEFKETCKYGCSNSTSPAKCNAAQCSSEERKCLYGDIYFCDDGLWKLEEDCKYGCDSSTVTCKQNNTCYKIEGKTWSDNSQPRMKKSEAENYCDNLTECGYSDWRLPTISELRTLIQKCPATESGGECGVTDSCLVPDCENDACKGCTNGSDYSKLGDSNTLWSNYGWVIDFGNASIRSSYNYNENVRCVR